MCITMVKCAIGVLRDIWLFRRIRSRRQTDSQTNEKPKARQTHRQKDRQQTDRHTGKSKRTDARKI